MNPPRSLRATSGPESGVHSHCETRRPNHFRYSGWLVRTTFHRVGVGPRHSSGDPGAPAPPRRGHGGTGGRRRAESDQPNSPPAERSRARVCSIVTPRPHTTRRRLRVPIGSAGTVGTIMLILLICLFPTSGETPSALRFCLLCGAEGTADFLRNILLFLPLGLSLWMATGSVPTAILLAGGLSLGVEITQVWIPGRQSTLGDFVANTLGAALGAGALAHRHVWLFPPRRVRPIVQIGYGTFVLVLLILPSLLFSVSSPFGTLYGNWNPTIGLPDAYQGRVVEARVGDLEVPSRRIEEGDQLARLITGGAEISMTFVAAASRAETTPIFRILNEERVEFLTLSTQGTSLLVRLRTRAADLRLSDPPYHLADALSPDAVGDTLTFQLVREPGGGHIATLSGGGSVRDGWHLERMVHDAWLLVLGSRRGRAAGDAWAGLLWVVLLALPLGWYGGHVTHGIVSIGLLLLILWVGTGSVALVRADAYTYLAIVAGGGAGYLVRHAGSRLAIAL